MPNTAWQPGQPLPDGMTPSSYTPNGPAAGPLGDPWSEPTPIPTGVNYDQGPDGNNYNQMGYYNPNMYGGGMSKYDPSYNYGGGDGIPKFVQALGRFNPYVRGGIGLWKLGGSIGNLLKRHGIGGGQPDQGGGNPLAHRMSPYDKNFNYGGGNVGPFGGLPSGFTEHRNAQGDYGAPNFYGPGGPDTQTGDWAGGSTFVNSGINGDPFRGGAFWSPPGGSIGGPLGTGSAGDVNMGGDYFGRESLNRLMQGRDATLGFGMTGNNTFLPPSQWGGVGAGGNTLGGSRVSGGTITQRRMSQV